MKQAVFAKSMFVAALVGTTPVWAHSFEQSVGVYTDDAGRERRQVGANLGIDIGPRGNLSGANITIGATRDEFLGGVPQIAATDTDVDEVYSHGLSAAATQTLGKLTELRQGITWNQEEASKSLTTTVGVSQWFAKESFRFSFDYLKNSVSGPGDEFLDADFETVSTPENIDTEGAAVALRHLMTTTTIVDVGAGYTSISNRPAATSANLGIRQFVPPAMGALLIGLTQLQNKGTLTTETTYGDISALEGRLGWAQNLWSGATSLIEYRYYREDEVTRAFGDELTVGSDAYTLGFDQQWQGDDNNIYHLTAKGSRYQTNVEIAARVFELGLGAQF